MTAPPARATAAPSSRGNKTGAARSLSGCDGRRGQSDLFVAGTAHGRGPVTSVTRQRGLFVEAARAEHLAAAPTVGLQYEITITQPVER